MASATSSVMVGIEGAVELLVLRKRAVSSRRRCRSWASRRAREGVGAERGQPVGLGNLRERPAGRASIRFIGGHFSAGRRAGRRRPTGTAVARAVDGRRRPSRWARCARRPSPRSCGLQASGCDRESACRRAARSHCAAAASSTSAHGLRGSALRASLWVRISRASARRSASGRAGRPAAKPGVRTWARKAR